MAGKYHIQEDIVDSYGITGLKDLDAQAVIPLSTSGGQQKMGKRPTKRALTIIIMQSDKATLNRAWKLYHYSEIKDHQGLIDFYSLKYA